MDATAIGELMAAEGPIVKAVMLYKDGTHKEITVDMTPAKNEVSTLLKGSVTLVGQWDDIHAVLMARKEDVLPEADDGAGAGAEAANAHKLQPPMHKLRVAGNILVVRMDADANPVDFPLSDYEEFCKRDIAPYDVPEAAAGGEDDGEENDEDEDDDPIEVAMGEAFVELKGKLGRDPTEDELRAALEAKGLVPTGDGDEEDEDEEGDDEEEDLPADKKALIESIIAELTASLRREPNEKEILDKMLERTMEDSDDDEDFEEDADDQDDEEEEEEEDGEAAEDGAAPASAKRTRDGDEKPDDILKDGGGKRVRT